MNKLIKNRLEKFNECITQLSEDKLIESTLMASLVNTSEASNMIHTLISQNLYYSNIIWESTKKKYEKQIEDINFYIKDEFETEKLFYSYICSPVDKLKSSLRDAGASEYDINKIISEIDKINIIEKSFAAMLNTYIDKKFRGKTNKEIFVDRGYFNTTSYIEKLRNNNKKNPGLKTVLKICFALKLDVQDSYNLLASANYYFPEWKVKEEIYANKTTKNFKLYYECMLLISNYIYLPETIDCFLSFVGLGTLFG